MVRRVACAFRTLVDDFHGNAAGSFAIVITNLGDHTDDIDSLASPVSHLPGVAAVTGPTGTYANGHRQATDPSNTTTLRQPAGTWLDVVPTADPRAVTGEQLVQRIRRLRKTVTIGVEGQAAELVDTQAISAARALLALAIVATITIVLPFSVFRSVLVPIKAVLLNLLSLTATFGAMV